MPNGDRTWIDLRRKSECIMLLCLHDPRSQNVDVGDPQDGHDKQQHVGHGCRVGAIVHHRLRCRVHVADAKVVAAIGTANIVGLCPINKVPVYLFANSLEFSFHPSSSQRIHTKTIPTSQDDVSYMLTTHSHDIVDLKLVDHLVTEDGKIEKPFMEKYVR